MSPRCSDKAKTSYRSGIGTKFDGDYSAKARVQQAKHKGSQVSVTEIENARGPNKSDHADRALNKAEKKNGRDIKGSFNIKNRGSRFEVLNVNIKENMNMNQENNGANSKNNIALFDIINVNESNGNKNVGGDYKSKN
ncbi:hypothetical protein ACOSQ4_002980 [Xanthoceras sorbifolium]